MQFDNYIPFSNIPHELSDSKELYCPDMERCSMVRSVFSGSKVDSPICGDVLIPSKCEAPIERAPLSLSTPAYGTYDTIGFESHDSKDEYNSIEDKQSDSSSFTDSRDERDLYSPTSSASGDSEEYYEEITQKKTQKRNLSSPIHNDGFKWRKYGQKQVKGSIFPRSYYKCTVGECPARKHIEKFIDVDGLEKEKTTYLNSHVHPAPNSSKMYVNSQEVFQRTIAERMGQPAGAPTPEQKRGRKRSGSGETKSSGTHRLVIECGDNVDYTEDCFSWRKYGQKIVKGSPKPRQYYKCTFNNCQGKKQIESTLSGTTIITYDGRHSHSTPKQEDRNALFEQCKKNVMVDCYEDVSNESSSSELYDTNSSHSQVMDMDYNEWLRSQNVKVLPVYRPQEPCLSERIEDSYETSQAKRLKSDYEPDLYPYNPEPPYYDHSYDNGGRYHYQSYQPYHCDYNYIQVPEYYTFPIN